MSASIVSYSSDDRNTDEVQLGIPSGAQAGDTLLAFMQVYAGEYDQLTGWTQISSVYDATNGMGYSIQWRTMQAGDGTQTFTSDGVGASAGTMIAVRGCEPTGVVDAYSDTLYIVNDTTLRAAGITIDSAPVIALYLGCCYGAYRTFSEPSGWTEIYDLSMSTAAYELTAGYKLYSSNTSTGNIDATVSSAINVKHAFAVALIEVSGPAAPTISAEQSGANIVVSWS